MLENIRICNDKKFYTKTFSEFIKEETKIIKEEIIHDKTCQKIIEFIKGIQKEIGKEKFSYPSNEPDEEMFEALNSIFEPMVDAYLANAVESKKLDQLAVILLPKLMSGEIDVSKVDLTLLNNHLYESKTGGCRGHPLFRRCKLHGPLWSFEWIYHLSNTGEQLIAHRGSNQIIRFAPDRSSRDLLYRIQGHS